MALHHFFYTAPLIMNFIVTSIYWPLLHHHCLAQNESDEMRTFSCCYCNHIIPIIVCLGNTLITNCVLSTKLTKIFLFLSSIYSIINYFQTKSRGKPVYEFW